MSLSIVIASLNDQDETIATCQSIRATAGDVPEIVVVDDCSGTPLSGYPQLKAIPNLKLISNAHRCGCGPSRHIGALNAKNDWLLIVDSHCRFTPNWLDNWTQASRAIPLDRVFSTVLCSTCIGLDRNRMDVEHPASVYQGATYNWHAPDRQVKQKMQTLEVVWNRKDEVPKDGTLAAVMGAAYFVSREWFLTLAPCQFLREWGQDELMISLKTYLAGGEIRLLDSVRIGHIFPLPGTRKRFSLSPGVVQWNKCFAAYTLFPKDIADRLVRHILSPDADTSTRDCQAAREMVRRDWHLIAAERAKNERMFTRDIHWLCERFLLPKP